MSIKQLTPQARQAESGRGASIAQGFGFPPVAWRRVEIAGVGELGAAADGWSAGCSHSCSHRWIGPVAPQVPLGGRDKAADIDAVVRANTVAVAEARVHRSAIVRKAVRAGRTQVVPTVDDLEIGQVSWQPDTA